MKPQKSENYTIGEFLEWLKKGKESIQKAAEILVSLVDKNPRVFAEIISKDTSIPYNLLGNLERVGRGQLYSALLYDSSPGARKLLALPPSQQRECYENPVKIVKMVGSKKVVEEKPIQQLSRHEANLLVDESGKLRSVEEQIKQLAQPQVTSSRKAERYEIKENGDVLVLSGSLFTPSQWEEIGKRAKDKAIKSLAK